MIVGQSRHVDVEDCISLLIFDQIVVTPPAHDLQEGVTYHHRGHLHQNTLSD